MANQNYAEKLKDPRWQKKRLEIFERDSWTCRFCLNSDSPLTVHHLCYFPKREPWEYEDDFLLTLCEDCHSNDTLSWKPISNQYLLRACLIEKRKMLEAFVGDDGSYSPLISKQLDSILFLLGK